MFKFIKELFSGPSVPHWLSDEAIEERKQQSQKNEEEVLSRLEKIKETENVFEIGDIVTYKKLEDKTKTFCVTYSRKSDYNWHTGLSCPTWYYILPSLTIVSYVDNNGIVQELRDANGCFEKVNKKPKRKKG